MRTRYYFMNRMNLKRVCVSAEPDLLCVTIPIIHNNSYGQQFKLISGTISVDCQNGLHRRELEASSYTSIQHVTRFAAL